MLILGVNDLSNIQKTGQTEELILSCKNTVDLGLTIDELGFPSRRFLALQCALHPDGRTMPEGYHIKYGSAEIKFYEGLGGPPPADWSYPYLPEPGSTSVSSDQRIDKESEANNDVKSAPMILPIKIHGQVVGFSSRFPEARQEGTGNGKSEGPPLNHGGNPSPSPPTTTSPNVLPTTVVTPPAVVAAPPDHPSLDLIRQLLKIKEPRIPNQHVSLHQCLKRDQADHDHCEDSRPPTPYPLLRPVPQQWNALNPRLNVSPYTSSPAFSTTANSSPASTPPSLPELIDPDETGYSSSEEMDWEADSEETDSEIDELLDDRGSNTDDEDNGEITREDVEAARTLTSLRFNGHAGYNSPQLPTPGPTPERHIPDLPPSPLGNRVEPSGLELLVRSTDHPTDSSSPLSYHPLTRSKAAYGVKKPLSSPKELYSTNELRNVITDPRTRPHNSTRLTSTQNDIQVYTMTVDPYDPTLLPPGLEETIRQRTIAREQSSSSSALIPTEPNSPSGSPSNSPTQAARNPPALKARLTEDECDTYFRKHGRPLTRAQAAKVSDVTNIKLENLADETEILPMQDALDLILNPSVTPTEPRSPSPEFPDYPTPNADHWAYLSPTPLPRIDRMQMEAHFIQKTAIQKGEKRRLKLATPVEKSAFPPVETKTPSAEFPTIRAATDMAPMDVEEDDLVIHHDPSTPAYPSPVDSVYANENVSKAVDMEDFESIERQALSRGVTTPPVIIPTPSSPAAFLQPPLPLSSPFRRRDISDRPKHDERKIPIRERVYHGTGDFEYSRPTARVLGYFNVDIRTTQILKTTVGVPSYCIKRFTILGGILEPFVIPFPLDSTPNGMAEIPPYSAFNWESRLEELHIIRKTVCRIIDDIIKCLTHDQYEQCNSRTIGIFRLRHGHLIPTTTARGAFLERLHPSFNNAVTRRETTFIRSAIYVLRDTAGYRSLADAADLVLRTGHYDSWLIRELVAMDCLGNRSRNNDALAFIEEVENERLDEVYEEFALYHRQQAKELAETERRHAAQAEQQGTKRKRRGSVISFDSDCCEDSDMSDDDDMAAE